MATRKPIEAAEQELPQSASINLDSAEVKRPDLKQETEIEVATSFEKSHAEELKFMEETVEILVHESTDKNAEPIVEVFCNGTPQRFIRGKPQQCKRKYLGILASAKETSIATNEAMNQMGERFTRIDKHTALKYPFSVIRDDNPRGATWLKAVLASA